MSGIRAQLLDLSMGILGDVTIFVAVEHPDNSREAARIEKTFNIKRSAF